jgi:hypothetical protein
MEEEEEEEEVCSMDKNLQDYKTNWLDHLQTMEEYRIT